MYLNNFQTYIFGSILLLMVCFVACEKSSDDVLQFKLGDSILLKSSEEAYIGGTSKLKLKVNDIKDSRCPADLVCIWGGEVVVKVTVTNSNNYSASFDLKQDGKMDTVDFSINSKAYQLILKGVTPYPNTSIVQDSSKAQLLILQK
jgi:hypothetical protein